MLESPESETPHVVYEDFRGDPISNALPTPPL